MKLNNKGWGYRMMALIMLILVSFLLIATYYIYRFYDRMKNDFRTAGYVVVVGEK